MQLEPVRAASPSTPEALHPDWVADDHLMSLLARNARDHGSDVALRERDHGIWQEYSWKDYHDAVLAFAAGLEAEKAATIRLGAIGVGAVAVAAVLGLAVDQFADGGRFDAAHGPASRAVQPVQPCHPVTAQHAVHSRGLNAQQVTDLGRAPAAGNADFDNPAFGTGGCLVGAAVWS